MKKINSNNDRNLGGYDPRKSNNFELTIDVYSISKLIYFFKKLPFYFNQKNYQNEEENDEDFQQEEENPQSSNEKTGNSDTIPPSKTTVYY